MGEIPSTIKALAEKKATLLREVATHRLTIQRLQAHIRTLDDAMSLLEPEFSAENIAPAGRKNRRTFASGQLARAIFAVLKRSPHPLSSREIAEQVAADCGKEQDIRQSVKGSLREQSRQGRVERVEDGMGGVRWRMASHAAAARAADEPGAPLRLCKNQ